MESERPNFLKSTMNYGIITGFAMVVFSTMLYYTGQSDNSALSYLSLAILAGCIFICTKHFRDKKNGGFLSYSQGLGVGTMTGVFAAVLLAFFLYLLLKFIDPNLMTKQLEAAQVQMLEKGMNEDEVEKATELSKKIMTPGMTFFLSVLSNGIVAFIISLITSAILKKDKDPFASQMEGIIDDNK